mgnify:CR=1 FL=1
MERGPAFLPDWRDAAAYAQLLVADRAILAWEWLRRVPAYRHDFERSGTSGDGDGAARWGLHRFEAPALAAPHARPLWTAAAMAPVLAVSARQAGEEAGIDLTALGALLTSHIRRGSDHVLLSDGWHLLRLDVAGARVRAGALALALRVALPGPPALRPTLLALRRLEALLRLGRFCAALHPPEARAARRIQVLRTADALAVGASQREIARNLLGGHVDVPGWRDEHPHVRLRAQRLVREARSFLAGGYRSLLMPPRGC